MRTSIYPAKLWIWTGGAENLFRLNEFALENFKQLVDLAAADSPNGPIAAKPPRAPATVNPTTRVDSTGAVDDADEYDGPGAAKWNEYRKPAKRKEYSRSGSPKYGNHRE